MFEQIPVSCLESVQASYKRLHRVKCVEFPWRCDVDFATHCPVEVGSVCINGVLAPPSLLVSVALSSHSCATSPNQD